MGDVGNGESEGCECAKDGEAGNRRPWHVPQLTILETHRTLASGGSDIDGIGGNRN